MKNLFKSILKPFAVGLLAFVSVFLLVIVLLYMACAFTKTFAACLFVLILWAIGKLILLK